MMPWPESERRGPPVPIIDERDEATAGTQPSKLGAIIATAVTPGQTPPMPAKAAHADAGAAVTRTPSGRKCSKCGTPGHRADRCDGRPREERIAPVRKPGELLEEAVFHSLGRGRLWLTLVTMKRVPFAIRMRHAGCGKPGAGVVAVATTEGEARSAWKRVLEQAAARRWRPGPAPATTLKLATIPQAPTRPYRRRRGPTPKKGAGRR